VKIYPLNVGEIPKIKLKFSKNIGGIVERKEDMRRLVIKIRILYRSTMMIMLLYYIYIIILIIIIFANFLSRLSIGVR